MRPQPTRRHTHECKVPHCQRRLHIQLYDLVSRYFTTNTSEEFQAHINTSEFRRVGARQKGACKPGRQDNTAKPKAPRLSKGPYIVDAPRA